MHKKYNNVMQNIETFLPLCRYSIILKNKSKFDLLEA